MTGHKLRAQRLFHSPVRITLPGLLILLSFLTGACVVPFVPFVLLGPPPPVHFRTGSRPNTDILDNSLRLGASTRADVVSALGEPWGKGRAILPTDPKLRTMPMWFYFYREMIAIPGFLSFDFRTMWLFIFFDEDRYDGYMWFSSLPKQSPGP